MLAWEPRCDRPASRRTLRIAAQDVQEPAGEYHALGTVGDLHDMGAAACCNPVNTSRPPASKYRASSPARCSNNTVSGTVAHSASRLCTAFQDRPTLSAPGDIGQGQ